MLGTAAVEELWQPHGTAKVKALKKRARRIRQEEPEYLRDLWAHCRAEEESTTEGSSTTESAPLEEQQDTLAEEKGDLPLPAIITPSQLLSPSPLLRPPPVIEPPHVFLPPPLSPAPPAMGDEEDIIIDVVNPVSPGLPGAGRQPEASAAAGEGPSAIEGRLDAVLALQAWLIRSLEVQEGMAVQAVTILHDLRCGQWEIIELLSTMVGAQSLLVMARDPAGRAPSDQLQ
ncbi:histone-lysine N-methyltransferase 2B-like isoform X1 [Rhinatrema bivittatum]|uniref:histone-lysine N-methyltransferase 2B-like isoform X1 n=1 Tax=Rhinatrema bivittatum TaxID=194408 RepID=UPI00112B798A|nr:histone-lysine N-methyltransferase 2B-like isoform X1 [Rhinatrema bivittatum]